MIDDEQINEKDLKEFNNICDECKRDHESVSQNLILTGFKLCESCRISKYFSSLAYNTRLTLKQRHKINK